MASERKNALLRLNALNAANILNLTWHLLKKHEYEPKDAAFKQSELRVLFLWAQRDKSGHQLPLPCEDCKIWHLHFTTCLGNIK